MPTYRAFHGVSAGLIGVSVWMLLVSQPATSQTLGQPEAFTATAIDINTGTAGTVEISIDRWSTETERRALAAALSKGPDVLLDTLRDIRSVGTVRTPDSLGYPLHFAQQVRGPDGGRRIMIATDRPISFWEARNRPRLSDYPFTFFELHMRPDGTGEGKLSIAAKIVAHDDDMVEIENYTAQPVRLENVRSRKTS